MPTFQITVAYDGTGFVGWQRQAEGTSIQGLLEDALRELDGRDVPVVGAGRTDAGVHALGQVAGFSIERAIAPEALVRALNAHLPEQVRVLTAVERPAAFHARFDALTKTYRYRLWNGDVVSPFARSYVWHIIGPLDVGRMDAAARLLEGRHDFAAFQAAGSAARSTEREILSSRVFATENTEDTERNGHRDTEAQRSHFDLAGTGAGCLVVYEVTGGGFLRHMVRNIVGTLVDVGSGRRPIDWASEVLASRDRARAGPTAPAGGLFLMRVEYPPYML